MLKAPRTIFAAATWPGSLFTRDNNVYRDLFAGDCIEHYILCSEHYTDWRALTEKPRRASVSERNDARTKS